MKSTHNGGQTLETMARKVEMSELGQISKLAWKRRESITIALETVVREDGKTL